MNRIILFSAQTCPFGDAGATRLHYLAKLFELINYNPTIVGICSNSDEGFGAEKVTDGITYHFFEAHNRNYLPQVRRYLKANEGISAVLVYSIPLNALVFLKKYTCKHNILLLHDSVEWYSKSEFRHALISYEYWRKELYNRIFIDKSFKVIGISSYLCSHFSNRGIQTLRIPAILDVRNRVFEKNIKSEYIIIAYIGGYAPTKDQLDVFLKSYIKMDSKTKEKIRLWFIGMSTDQVASIAGIDVSVVSEMHCISCFGKVKRDKLLEMMKEVDYTILIRRAGERYSQAGFPTKVVESLASATPVIANLTSDLGFYLQDGINSFVLKDLEPSYIEQFLKDLAQNLQIGQRMEMANFARRTADKYFDYSVYRDALMKLIGGNNENF